MSEKCWEFGRISADNLPGDAAMSTLFTKIINREIPGDIVYEDGQVTAFRDIDPAAPIHILIVPNKEIATVNDVTEDDTLVIGRMVIAAAKIAQQEGIAEDGYRLVINCGPNGNQEVFHIHMHLLAGKNLGPILDRSYSTRGQAAA